MTGVQTCALPICRLEVYADQTAPIVGFYRNEGLLRTISALGSVDEVAGRAISALSK